MADDNTFSSEIERRLKSLPEDVRKLVYSANMDAAIQKIGAKHQLHVDQMGMLESETVSVMIGLTDPKEFGQNIMEDFSVSREKADAIAQDINETFFLKIRESMKKVQEQSTVTPTPQTTAPAPSAPPPMPTPQPTASKAPEMHPADLILTQKTISTPPVAPIDTTQKAPEPPAPGQYKADPYREPPE